MTSRIEAFKHFGVHPANVRWSWCAPLPDGTALVVCLWKDKFTWINGRGVYVDSLVNDNRPGAQEMRRCLQWARDYCGGRLLVIVNVPTNEEPRRIKDCYPSKMVMRLTRLDLISGEFAAELVTSNEAKAA